MSFQIQKKILIFNDSLALGGTEKLLVNLLNHLVTKKCSVTLILPVASQENVLLPDVSENVKILYLYSEHDSASTQKWGEVKMVFKTNAFLKNKQIIETDYDEVVCFKEGFYAKMFGNWQIPKTLWLHNILYVREYEVNSLKEKFAVALNKKQIAKAQLSYAHYDRVIAVSEACKQSYLDVVFGGCLPIQDIRIVPNAIDLNKVKELSTEYISEDFSTAKIKFVLVTRMSPDKRTDRMIEASHKLLDEGYEFDVHIIGNGTDSDEMKAQLEKLGLQQTVHLHGKKSNPYPYIKQSNWLVCVSQRESFSLAILEAMALGVPIITTNCGGPANIVENGRYGILVDNSEQGVYEGMKSVLDDTTLAEKYSADLEKCISRYNYANWLKTVDKLLSL